MSIIELIEQESLDARLAAFLWLAIEHRSSLVVSAVLHNVGKTTMLTALLDFLPNSVERIYLRGLYERFEFLEDPKPERAYLLCNEISSHLPIYMWGRGVRRLFEGLWLNYGMATTVHANGAAEVMNLLSSYPLEVPPQFLAKLDLVLTLGVGQGTGRLLRRVMRVEMVHDRDGEPVPETIAERDVLRGSIMTSPGRLIGILTDRFGMDRSEATTELARRERFLNRLEREGVRSVEAVRDEIINYASSETGGHYTDGEVSER